LLIEPQQLFTLRTRAVNTTPEIIDLDLGVFFGQLFDLEAEVVPVALGGTGPGPGELVCTAPVDARFLSIRAVSAEAESDAEAITVTAVGRTLLEPGYRERVFASNSGHAPVEVEAGDPITVLCDYATEPDPEQQPPALDCDLRAVVAVEPNAQRQPGLETWGCAAL
jgi:hypothetical protein